MILYSITRGPRGFMLAKFDEDFNVAAVYNVNNRTCDCPAGHRPTCKHRKMLPRMLAKVDSGEFYCYETQTWHQPLGDLARPEAGDLAGREALPDARAPDGLLLSSHKAIDEATSLVAGEAVPISTEAIADMHRPGSLTDLLLNGNPAMEGKLPGVLAPTIRRR